MADKKSPVHAIIEPEGFVAIRTACGRVTAIGRQILGRSSGGTLDLANAEYNRDLVTCSGCKRVVGSRPKGWSQHGYHYRAAPK